mgnify:CR=1 FL=1
MPKIDDTLKQDKQRTASVVPSNKGVIKGAVGQSNTIKSSSSGIAKGATQPTKPSRVTASEQKNKVNKAVENNNTRATGNDLYTQKTTVSGLKQDNTSINVKQLQNYADSDKAKQMATDYWQQNNVTEGYSDPTKFMEDLQAGKVQNSTIDQTVHDAQALSGSQKAKEDYAKLEQEKLAKNPDYLNEFYDASGKQRDVYAEYDNLVRQRDVETDKLKNGDLSASKKLIQINKKIEEVSDKKDFMDARVQAYQYDWVMENGTDEEKKQVKDLYSHYEDTFLERRLTGLGTTLMSLGTTVTGSLGIALDVGKEIVGYTQFVGAELGKGMDLLDSKEYDHLMELSQKNIDFKANDDGTITQQIRNEIAKLSQQKNFGAGELERLIGEGIDSNASFLINFGLFGPGGTLTAMGIEGGVSRYYECLDAGYGTLTSLTNGTLHGVASALTESLGLDNFMSLVTGTAGAYALGEAGLYIAKGLLTQALSEGTEEGVEYLLDFAIDKFTDKMSVYGTGAQIAEFNPDELFENIICGSIGGSTLGAVGAAKYAIQTNADYSSLLGSIKKAEIIRDTALREGNMGLAESAKTEIERAQLALSAFDETSRVAKFVTTESNQDTTIEQDGHGIRS